MAKPNNTSLAKIAEDTAAALAAGADVHTGEIMDRPAVNNAAVIQAGDLLRAQQIGLPEGFDMSRLTVVRKVTRPVLTFPDGGVTLLSFVEPIREGDELTDGARGPITRRAQVAPVLTFDGSEWILVVGTVLQRELDKGYPNNTYVGRWFVVKKIAPNTERQKKDATYQITEVADPQA